MPITDIIRKSDPSRLTIKVENGKLIRKEEKPGFIPIEQFISKKRVVSAEPPRETLGLSRIGEMRTSTLAMAGGDIYLPVLEKVAKGFLDTFLPAVRPTLEKYMTGKSLVQSYRETWQEMDESRKSKEEEVKQRVVEAQSRGASSWELSKIAIESPAMQLMEQTAVGFMGGIKFVSGNEARNIIAQAVKSKITRQDLINITRGTMKDTAKLDAYKVMTTNPQMKAELLRVAQNKKLPTTQRLSEYLETKLTSKDIASFKLKTETKIPVVEKPLELPIAEAKPITKLVPEAKIGVKQVIPVEKGILPAMEVKPQELSGFKNFIDITKTKVKDIPYKEMNIAERVKEDKVTPAIRKSGFFATKEIQTAPIRDVYEQALHPHHMALKQDGYKLGGEFGEIFKKVWKPTEKAIRSEKEFDVKVVKEIKALGEKHKIKASKQNLERLSDVIEKKVKATPQEEVYIKELRDVLDDLREQANVVRRSMGKSEIGYIEDYIPHLQRTTLWNELLSNQATISDNLDFIIPNQVRNPFAFKRLLEEMPKAERNLYVLLDRYIRAIGRDVYITPAIENIKAYNSVLKNREMLDAFKYWNEYIRTGLIGKQHKLDAALSISQTGRKVLQKWNSMVNLAFLTGKVAWNIATQPLSYIMNVPMETGVINSIKAIYKSFGKGLRQYVKENSNVLNIKSSDVRAIAIGEGRNIQNRIYRTKINKYNDFISMIGSIEERELTLTSYIAGLERAKGLGYKGQDALWFADLTAARTQSMYNKENRALIMNSDIARFVFPFQSFSVEMFNHAKEIISKSSGAMKLTYRQRFGKLFGLLIGLYLSNLYSKSLVGRGKTTVGTFIPFIGSWVDMAIAQATGGEYYGGRSPITTVQIGQDIIGGAKDFINHGDLKKLRKVGLNFGLALGGIGGGGQINNIIDGIMADIDEDVKNIEGDVMFEVKDTISKIKAPFFGVWATKEGREYWEPKEKETVPIRGKSRLEGEIRQRGESRI